MEINNAIEVLKDMIEFEGEYVPKIVLSKSEHYSDELWSKQQIALKEALLALESKENDRKQGALDMLIECKFKFNVLTTEKFMVWLSDKRKELEGVGVDE